MIVSCSFNFFKFPSQEVKKWQDGVIATVNENAE